MRTAVAMLAVFALVGSTPLVALSQSTTPPAQSPPAAPAPAQGSATTVVGVVANVDATCGGEASADCQAIVEVAASPSQGGSSSATTPTATMKITIPKNLKITAEGASATASTPVKLAKGDQVKITYEKKQDTNVATSVTITKSGS